LPIYVVPFFLSFQLQLPASAFRFSFPLQLPASSFQLVAFTLALSACQVYLRLPVGAFVPVLVFRPMPSVQLEAGSWKLEAGS
jgi:hypothetical protein